MALYCTKASCKSGLQCGRVYVTGKIYGSVIIEKQSQHKWCMTKSGDCHLKKNNGLEIICKLRVYDCSRHHCNEKRSVLSVQQGTGTNRAFL